MEKCGIHTPIILRIWLLRKIYFSNCGSQIKAFIASRRMSRRPSESAETRGVSLPVLLPHNITSFRIAFYPFPTHIASVFDASDREFARLSVIPCWTEPPQGAKVPYRIRKEFDSGSPLSCGTSVAQCNRRGESFTSRSRITGASSARYACCHHAPLTQRRVSDTRRNAVHNDGASRFCPSCWFHSAILSASLRMLSAALISSRISSIRL